MAQRKETLEGKARTGHGDSLPRLLFLFIDLQRDSDFLTVVEARHGVVAGSQIVVLGMNFIINVGIQTAKTILPIVVSDVSLYGEGANILQIDHRGWDAIFVFIHSGPAHRAQCGILSIAAVAEPMTLDRYLSGRDRQRLLVFCDEAADATNPLQALQGDRTAPDAVDVLIGPEGGFAEEERALLLRQPRTLRLSLGPRILRADTAAVAALALVQAVLGDWTGSGPGG